MDEHVSTTGFCEDDFDLGKHKKAAIKASRKKISQMRAKRNINLGKAALTIAAVCLFVFLFFAAAGLLAPNLF